jgi:hypothetical protein
MTWCELGYEVTPKITFTAPTDVAHSTNKIEYLEVDDG